ncbi:MAG TPA: hypothetical protein VFR88_15890 [Microlunatus sp.]|nr:hypothetical protein [Microlunatus sp.]
MPLDNPLYIAEMPGAYELRSIGRFGFEQSYRDEVDRHLSDLLAVER